MSTGEESWILADAGAALPTGVVAGADRQKPLRLHEDVHEVVVAAVVAVQAQEPAGEDAAAQERARLLLDEVRRGTLARARNGSSCSRATR